MNPVQALDAIETLSQAVPGVRRVVLADPQGTLLARAGNHAAERDGLLFGAYGDPLRLAQAAAAEMGWGAVCCVSIRGEEGLVVFSLQQGEFTLGVEAGPATVSGWLREEASRTLAVCRS